MGIMRMWRFCSWALLVLATLAVAGPGLSGSALAEYAPFYGSGGPGPRHDFQRPGGPGPSFEQDRRRPRDLMQLGIEPSRLGPPPMGFLYRCDAPQGFYPYIPACHSGWRVVRSGPPR
jgi:hypothetical protein